MTFKEAVESKKAVRRSGESFGKLFGFIKYGYPTEDPFEYLFFEYGNCTMPLTIEDVTANDWELEQSEKVEYKLTDITYNGKQLYEKIEPRTYAPSTIISTSSRVIKR